MVPGRSDRLAGRARRQLGRIDPRSDRPHGLVRLGVAVCVALTLALGLVYFAKAVDRLRTDLMVEIPGADLLLANAFDELTSGVIEAKVIGSGVDDGVE